MPNMKKRPSDFKSEDEERRFWATADSTEYVNWQSGKRGKLVQLKPSLRTISLRLPISMIEDLKVLANRRDVPYQSLLKVFLAERLARERNSKHDEPPPATLSVGRDTSNGDGRFGLTEVPCAPLLPTVGHEIPKIRARWPFGTTSPTRIWPSKAPESTWS